jgi:hypothetical protein
MNIKNRNVQVDVGILTRLDLLTIAIVPFNSLMHSIRPDTEGRECGCKIHLNLAVVH